MDPRFEEEKTTAADTSAAASDGIEINTDDLGADQPAAEMELEQLIDAVQEASLAIKKGKEPIFQLAMIRDCLRQAIVTDRMGSDSAFNDYLNKTLGIRLMPSMARERSVDDDYLNVCAELLEVWMDVFIQNMKQKRYNNEFVCAVTWCFQPNCNLHNLHFQYTQEEVKSIVTSHQVWRKEIDVGSNIDIQVGNKNVQGWMAAKVISVQGDILDVEFTESTTDLDRSEDRWSTRIAPAGSKTKEDYEWRENNLRGAQMLTVDAFDSQEWIEATIIKTQSKEVAPGRVVEYARIGFRVYKKTGRKLREDENGTFEGLPSKYDEWVPIYGLHIAQHLTKSLGQTNVREEEDEELDKVIQPSYGFERVYVVPRISCCLSKKFLYMMDKFGNQGGFSMLLDVLENEDLDNSDLSLTSLGYMITLVSMSYKLWHRKFIDEFAERFCNAINKRFLQSDDVKIRDLDQSCSYQAIRATCMIKQRYMERSVAFHEWQVFKLQFIKKCLESQFLEKRITGIKDLNEIIVKTIEGNDAAASQEIIGWIQDNGVFSLIWDSRKTHVQLVQRSADIFRCFLKQDLMSEELLAQFWNLSKSNYKQEVFKILHDCDFYLEQPQMEYLFNQITETPALKLGIEEFDLLSMLGRRCKLNGFVQQVSIYFWRIISDSDAYSQDVVDTCVNRFCEMIKFWSIGLKKPWFERLADFMATSSAPSIPVLQLFQKIIDDHKQKERLMSKQSDQTGSTSGWTNNYGNVNKWVGQGEPIECRVVLDVLEQEKKFSEAILHNLTAYFELVGSKQINQNEKKKLLRIVSQKYTHQEELDQRLKFLQSYAANSSFEFTRVQLKVVYDLLAASPVKGDLEEFLKWCKQACENHTDRIVDLKEVGEFFSDQIAQGVLDLKSMPATGFHFIQMFFVSANIDASTIIKTQKPKKDKKKKKYQAYNNFYSLWDEAEEEEEEVAEVKDESQYFNVMGDPTKLHHLDIIWQIVLESNVKQVYESAIDLLVYSHLSVETTKFTSEDRSGYVKQLLEKCFDLIKPEANPSVHMVSRVTALIKEVIKQSEKSGNSDVRPHRSILKGELIDRVVIKYIGGKNVWGEEKVDRAIVVKLYTSCTLWELKSEIARIFGLAPKYVELELPGKKIVNEKEHGFDMQHFGIKLNDIITARKISLNEFIPQASLVDEESQSLTPRAVEIFTDWFNMFKNPVKDKMDNFSVARFISKTTKADCRAMDARVQDVISRYDKDDDQMLTLQDFLQFYYDAAEEAGDKRQACFKNLKNLNYRPDLVKLSDVVDVSLFEKDLMPRFMLQANESQYQALWNLLERQDETCEGTWELIRMLATNSKQYMEVIRMSNVTDEQGEVDWNTFFMGSSAYQKAYLQEIILSVLEDSEESQGESQKRVMFVQEQKVGSSSYAAAQTKTEDQRDTANPSQPAESSNDADANEEETEEQKRATEVAELRLNWSRNFLERGGFQYIMSQIYALDVESGDKRQIEFMLTLVRVFLTAAFATDSHKDIGQAVKLVRKSSSIDDSDTLDRQTKKQKDDKKEDKLQELLHGEFGMEILLSTNYHRLQQKILALVFNILQQKSMTLEEKIIIENAMSVWVGASLYKPELFEEFLAFSSTDGSNVEDFILSGLVFCSEDKIRQDFQSSLLALAKNFDMEKRQMAQRFLLGILGKNFERVIAEPCSHYFDLFTELIDTQAMQDGLVDELSAEDSEKIASYDPETLLAQIIDKIVASQRSTTQKSSQDTAVDEEAASQFDSSKESLLVGLITLTKKIIQNANKELADKVIQEKNLINMIFKEFLFSSYFKAQEEKAAGVAKKEVQLVQRTDRGKKDGKGASMNRSREAAFSLLIELVKKSGVLMANFLNQVLMPMLNSVDKPKGWNYSPPSKEAGEGRVQEYVGLRNLGCICYMNSMMQQFFMIPALRYNLLCVNDGKEKNLVEYKGRQVDDNMFHQMQKLFAHLELSDRMDYNPFGFCFAFKEFDGGPTNTAEQKDAQEFLNLLFDRLETALKPTPRKYLLQGIFGGQQVSQMVCTECGNVKNRHEDFLNLSLAIKDIKSVYESLQKQIEGEIISDYQCGACNRKVDLSKRTLISETPNILIVHLQRIGFDFETYETEKWNTLCSFPKMLDLKPYSYFEVMAKEDRLKEKVEIDEKKKKEEEDAMTEEELKQKREKEEEQREPIQEDCFEYKLVGVNVHSGSANMGHYWSYINTNRGVDEHEGNQNWIRTEQDPWMEFNDSRVSDYNFGELEKQCFGNDDKSGFMGESYGTSGYMLFYERRRKKDLKILVEEEKVEEEQKKGTEVQFDEEKKEHYKMAPYREAANGEKANPIYQQVFEDNHNVGFENDIYSAEFFDFVMKIMQGVAGQNDAIAKEMGLQIGKKVGFDILARCYDNTGVMPLSYVMIDILKGSDSACLDFMSTLLNDDDGEPVMEILFDCIDKMARKYLMRIIRYLICRLKDIEKDAILANEFDTIDETYVNAYGEQVTRTRKIPKSLVLKFMNILQGHISVRAARSWKIMDSYMEVLFTFGVQCPADLEAEFNATNTQSGKMAWDRTSSGYQVGLTEYFRTDFLTTLGDFILQEKSPLFRGSNDYRITMGNYYSQPDFDKALLLITIMMSEQKLQEQYPFSEVAKAITSSKSILQQMLKASEGSGFDQPDSNFTEMLNLMCYNSYPNTKKMAKVYIKDLLNKNHVDDIQKGLRQVRNFLSVNDNLKTVRMEWIFGVPQLVSKRIHQRKTTEIGVGCIDYINKESCLWKSGIVKSMGDAMLTEMFKAQKTRTEFTIYCMLDLLEMCVADERICEYIYNQPPPTYQYARYSDWFERFATELRAHFVAQGQKYTTYQDLQKKENINILTQILSILPTFREKCKPFEDQWRSQQAQAAESDFEGYKSVNMVGSNPEVLDHFPPQYIIGSPLNDPMEPVAVEENDYVTVRMYKVEVEYMYGNPTGLYNLSLPEKRVHNQLDFRLPDLNYAQYKKQQEPGFVKEDIAKDGEDDKDVEDMDDEEEFVGLDVRQWHNHSLITEIYRIDVENNTRDQVKVEIGVEADDESTDPPNCHVPLTSFQTTIFATGMTAKPITAMITKIDPSKPLGKLKLMVGAKRISNQFSGSMGGGNYGGTRSGGTDPTYTSAYRDVVNSIQTSNLSDKRSVGFFVSEGNIDGIQGTKIDAPTGESTQGTGARRQGFNMGQIDQVGDDLADVGEGGDDGEAGYGSNENNYDVDDNNDNNFDCGSDLEQDLLN